MFEDLLHPSTTFTIASITVNGVIPTRSSVEIGIDHLATLRSSASSVLSMYKVPIGTVEKTWTLFC